MQTTTATATAKTKKDKLRTEYDDGTTRVVLTNARFYCGRCEKWKPASAFGKLRRMSGGTIRNQPCCSPCR